MQELLGLVEQMFANAKTKEVESAMNDVINIITQEGLPTEKKQISNARLDGFKISGEGWNGEFPFEWEPDNYIVEKIRNEQYYNETYGL